MSHHRSCGFRTLKWFILIFLIIGFITEAVLLIAFLVDTDAFISGIESSYSQDKSTGSKVALSEEDKSAIKWITGIALSIMLIVTTIQLYGVYKENFCIVAVMTICILISTILFAVNRSKTGSGDSMSSANIGSSIFWFLLTATYAYLIKSSRDNVEPFQQHA
ncbi:hypothetical protein HDE_10696 [Halotydeus destructor]|nr:hypothetical protein HDE_10696 [Halotydeus destructor]